MSNPRIVMKQCKRSKSYFKEHQRDYKSCNCSDQNKFLKSRVSLESLKETHKDFPTQKATNQFFEDPKI